MSKIPDALPYVGGGAALTLLADALPGKVGTVAKLGGLGLALYGVYQIFTGKAAGAEAQVGPGLPGVPQPAARYVGARIIAPAEKGKSGLNNFWTVFMGKTTRSYRVQYELTNRGDDPVTVVADFVVKEFAIGGPREGTEVRVSKTVRVPAQGSQIVTIDEFPVRSSVTFKIDAVAQVEVRGEAAEPMRPVSMARLFTIEP